jgi:IclR family pca regulon transcriptional regulator
MKPDLEKSPYIIQALLRGLDVLSQFSNKNPGLTMSEVVATTSLNKATAFRILSTLEAAGYLRRDHATRRYSPTLKILQLGFTAVNHLDVSQVAAPYLEKLAQQLDLTVSLSVLETMDVVYIRRIRNREIVGVLLGIGDSIPAHCSSMGKVILANLPETELAGRLADAVLEPCTPRSIMTTDQLRAELKTVREQGYAFNDDELASGLRAVAAPIFYEDQVVAALNVSGSHDAISETRLYRQLPAHVQAVARKISEALNQSGIQ